MSQVLQTRVAFLESQVDHLQTELFNLNELLVACGFPGGITTLKVAVQEILKDKEHPEDSSSELI